MDNIHLKYSDKFRSHWIKIKFYKEKPKLKGIERIKNVRFCEATRRAILHPVVLEKSSISCPGARYAFGWDSDQENLLKSCAQMFAAPMPRLQSMLSRIPQLPGHFKYIGLNTEGIPDLILSYVLPQTVMDLLKHYSQRQGKDFKALLFSMMPVCAGVVVQSYLEQKLSLSFGSADSRNFANIGPNYVAVGIPQKLFQLFLNQ